MSLISPSFYLTLIGQDSFSSGNVDVCKTVARSSKYWIRGVMEMVGSTFGVMALCPGFHPAGHTYIWCEDLAFIHAHARIHTRAGARAHTH